MSWSWEECPYYGFAVSLEDCPYDELAEWCSDAWCTLDQVEWESFETETHDISQIKEFEKEFIPIGFLRDLWFTRGIARFISAFLQLKRELPFS